MESELVELLDLDEDGQLTSNDLDLIFLELDEDGNGVVEAMRPPRRMGRGRGF